MSIATPKFIIQNFFEKHDISLSSSRAAIALSGGMDSMCLALLIFRMQLSSRTQPLYKPIALIVDHDLRSNSAEEASNVAYYAKTHLLLNVQILRCEWGGAPPQHNVHEVARKARYKLLLEYCNKHNIKYLLVAHHRDDQAETILMHILRGSGIDGLCGMGEVVTRDNIIILRPMLQWSRKEIERIMTSESHIWYVNDTSNYDKKYTRTHIRYAMPILANAISDFRRGALNDGDKAYDLLTHRLLLLTKNAQRAASYIESEVARHIDAIVMFCQERFAFTICDEISLLHEEIILRILRKVIAWVIGADDELRCVRLNGLERLYKWIQNNMNVNGYAVYTLGKCEVVLCDIVNQNNDIAHGNKFKVMCIIKEGRYVVDNIAHLQAGYGEKIIWDNRFVVQNNSNKEYAIASCTKLCKKTNGQQLYVENSDVIIQLLQKSSMIIGWHNKLNTIYTTIMRCRFLCQKIYAAYPIAFIADKIQ